MEAPLSCRTTRRVARHGPGCAADLHFTDERRQGDATTAALLLPSGSDVPAAPLSSEEEEGGGREGGGAAPRLGQSGSPVRRSSAPRLLPLWLSELYPEILSQACSSPSSRCPPPPPTLFPTSFSKLIFHPPTRFHRQHANLSPFFYSSLSSFSSPSPHPQPRLTHRGQ